MAVLRKSVIFRFHRPILPEPTQPYFFWNYPTQIRLEFFAFQDSTIENAESGSIHLCNMPIKKCVVYYFKLYPLDILEAQILDIGTGLSLVVFISD